MPFFVAEADDLAFDGGAITGSDALDGAVEDRRFVQMLADDLERFGSRVNEVARKLFTKRRELRRALGKGELIVAAFLDGPLRKIDRGFFDARRRPRLQTEDLHAHLL